MMYMTAIVCMHEMKSLYNIYRKYSFPQDVDKLSSKIGYCQVLTSFHTEVAEF